MKEVMAQERPRIYALLGIDTSPEAFTGGGIERFMNVPYQNIAELAALLGDDFLNGRQNSAPTIGEFLEDLHDSADNTYFHGYIVSPTRDDERIAIDAVTTLGTYDNISALRFADTFDLDEDGLYVRWG